MGGVVEGIRTMFGNMGKFVYIPELKPQTQIILDLLC